MNDTEPGRRPGLGRTGGAVATIATVAVIVAPIISFFFAGSRTSDPIDWGAFFRTAGLTWFVISLLTIVGVTLWLWLGWESPGSDSMEDTKEIS